ncbi:EthD domain-containing protein [Pseudodonghicola flavimaris]|uniref:EthD domain-containing protein n=1 Tax=Pseudodonghicola flavimaris TaxID=3050036 RepID=A0ABT7EXI9_9RHOB|nr:hypothetical protein [Pseudodonghicola flavimaris]MDK3017065.1 hypothetical protein [Pseudodonghicola flavimaris]
MFVLELSIFGPASPLTAWIAAHGPALAVLPDVARAELYRPYEEIGAGAPYHDPNPPAALITLGFDGEAALRAALEAPALQAALQALPDGARAEAGAFRRHRHALPGDDLGVGGGAAYVVRYKLPCSDRAGFVTEYLAGHLPIQADFPGIRRILGLEPVDGTPAGTVPANYLVGNEVTFDDIGSFAAAMASDVVPRLKAHSAELPPRDGACTHHLMQRRPLA